jgi:hypothetical protein
MRKTVTVLMLFALVCCTGKKEQNQANTGNLGKYEVVSNTEFLKEFYKNNIINEKEPQYTEENSFQITQEEANVYVLPTVRSKIKGKLVKGKDISILGFAEAEGTIKGQTEHWVKIQYIYDTYAGWIQSDVINIENFVVSELHIESSSFYRRHEAYQGDRLILHGKYIVENQEREFSVGADKVDGQDFCLFWWNGSNENFHYSTRPGLYIWNEDKKELKHITYIDGIDGEIETNSASGWDMVTNDYKYLIQDYGSAPPPRGIAVWNLDNGEKIFSGSYYEHINLNGHTIEIIKRYDEYFNGKWLNRENGLTKEEIDYAKRFIETNKPPADLLGMANTGMAGLGLILVLEYNLDNGKTKIKEGKYIGVQ